MRLTIDFIQAFVLQLPSFSGSDGLYFKAFILFDISIAAALYILWRRRQQKIMKAEKARLKKNIMKLREEKLKTGGNNAQLDEVRKRLQSSKRITMLNDKARVHQAKKLSISTGELELAAKLKILDDQKKNS